METHFEASAGEAADPRLIPGISNYCHRWCERCPFTDRCMAFRETSRYERDNPDAGPLDHVEDSLRKTTALLAEWSEREGIDFEKVQAEAKSDEMRADLNHADEMIDTDPLVKAAKEYGHRALDIVKGLEKTERLSTWPPQVRAAIETIDWYALYVSVKVHLALHVLSTAKGDEIENYGLQSDWNLSAKAARMAIAESCRAWAIVLDAGNAPPQSFFRELVGLLTSIDTDLSGRFSRAMEGVRPGFDEPDVAAGALTTLECFEPRSWQRSGQ
jgi:hypothetical protein